jgi:hypothetical protein
MCERGAHHRAAAGLRARACVRSTREPPPPAAHAQTPHPGLLHRPLLRPQQRGRRRRRCAPGECRKGSVRAVGSCALRKHAVTQCGTVHAPVDQVRCVAAAHDVERLAWRTLRQCHGTNLPAVAPRAAHPFLLRHQARIRGVRVLLRDASAREQRRRRGAAPAAHLLAISLAVRPRRLRAPVQLRRRRAGRRVLCFGAAKVKRDSRHGAQPDSCNGNTTRGRGEVK